LVAARDLRPKHLAVAQHDQFNPTDAARAQTSGWTNTRVDEIPGTDHFLAGRMSVVADGCVAFARSLAVAS
jgi:alpha/beta superfamily hydrolase